MNSKYAFIPGEENLKTYQSIQNYIDDPAGAVLVLLGPPSCGKSILLDEVVRKMRSSTYFKVKMFTSESLKNGLMTSIRDGTTDQFWRDLLNADMLIVDDAQFITHGIDDVIVQLSEIYQRKNKRVILAGDYLLNGLRVIPNLRVLKLVRPGLDTRRLIVQEIAKEKALVLDEKLIDLIAEKVDDPRRIRGVISWIYANQNEGGCSMEDDSNISQILKAEIAAQHNKLARMSHRTPFYVIARALVKLGGDRSKARAGGGWICGNHANAVHARVQAKLETDYSEDELNDLISHCVSGEADAQYETILKNLTNEIPLVYVSGI